MRHRKTNTVWETLLAAVALMMCSGCASPGAPRAPSLRLPEPVKNLAAEREANKVLLKFTVSARTTDKLLVREKNLGVRVCREVEHSACETVPLAQTTAPVGAITLTEVLPTGLASGPSRLLAYRVELLNDRGKSAGMSERAYAVGGSAPAAVEKFSAKGSRLGVLLAWTPVVSDESMVVIERDQTAHKPALLRANDAGQAQTLDTAADADVAYRYVAHREREVTLGARTLKMRGADSAAVEFTLRDVYPPPVPTDLTAAGFAEGATFAVDLIWQPVEDPGLAGYNVYRDGVKLNTALVALPSFHDATAKQGTTYRYAVTAVDKKGNESSAATVEVK